MTLGPPTKRAIRLIVHVGEDRLLTLPDEVPIGPAEVVVLVEERAGARPLDDCEPIQPARPARLSELVTEDRN